MKRTGLARTTAFLLVAIMYTSQLLPNGVTTHIFGMERDLPAVGGNVPSTGLHELDALLSQHLEEADATAERDVEPLFLEPQVPATYYYDGVERRIGGFGERVNLVRGAPSTSWHEHTMAAFDGALGYRFSDPTGTRYPLGVGGVNVQDYLFTPLISLQGVRVRTDGTSPEDSQYLDSTTKQVAENIRLSFNHRFNLAAGLDGGRVEVFDSLPTAGFPVIPIAVLAPTPSSQATQMMRAAAFAEQSGGPLAFTGQAPEWEFVTYDLSPWDGQEIYLGFHAATTAPSTGRGRYFSSQANFPQPLDFFGWHVDSIFVEGPALLHNVRLYSIQSPALDGTGQRSAPSGPRLDGDYYEAVATVENRGSYSETLTPRLNIMPTLALTPNPGPCVLQGADWAKPLLPGDNRAARFRCKALAEGAEYRFTFEAPLARDDDQVDNQWPIDVHAHRNVKLTVIGTPSIEPTIGETDQPRRLALSVRNDGNDVEQIDMVLSILRDGVPVSGPKFAIESPGPLRSTLALAPGSIFTPSPWTFILGEVGQFELHVTIMARGSNVDSWVRSASSRTSIGTLFLADHVDTLGATGPGIRGDPRMSVVRDPWNDPSGSDEIYWRLTTTPGPGTVGSDDLSGGVRPALVGRPNPDDPALNQAFSAIEISLTHAFRRPFGFPMDPVLRLSIDPRTQPSSPQGASEVLGQISTLIRWNTLQTQGRFDNGGFYQYQWVHESFTIRPTDFNVSAAQTDASPPNFPPAILRGFQVRLQGNEWRIGQLDVFGMRPDDTKVLLLSTGGPALDDRGIWMATGMVTIPASGQSYEHALGCPPVPALVCQSAGTRVVGGTRPESAWRQYAHSLAEVVNDFYPRAGDERFGFWRKGGLLPNFPLPGHVPANDFGILTTPAVFIDPAAPDPALSYYARQQGSTSTQLLVRILDSDEPDLFFPVVPPPSFELRASSSCRTSGSPLGGTTVCLIAADVQPRAIVTFDGIPATEFSSVRSVLPDGTTSTMVTVISPPHTPGLVDIVLMNPDGQTWSQPYTYQQYPPAIFSVTPTTIPTNGGATMTIMGENFLPGSSVTVTGATVDQSSVVVSGDGLITFTVPPRSTAGTATVIVTIPDTPTQQTASTTFHYEVDRAPTISKLTPSSGSTNGGSTVRIEGANFVKGATVDGIQNSNVVFVNPSLVTFKTLSSGSNAASIHSITLRNPDSQASNPQTFTYSASLVPIIDAVTPPAGSANGGAALTVSGRNFAPGAIIVVDGSDRTTTVADAQTLTATLPPRSGIDGDTDKLIKVRNPDQGLSAGFPFTYQAAPSPAITAALPPLGPSNGGTTVEIQGRNFARGATVSFGAPVVSNVIGPDRIVAVVPPIQMAGPTGATLDVGFSVTNPDGRAATSTFTFVKDPPPLFSSAMPNVAVKTNGTTTIIKGANFVAGANVEFISSRGFTGHATNVAVLSSSTISADTPRLDSGGGNWAEEALRLRVVNPDKQGASSPASAFFVYEPIPSTTPHRVVALGDGFSYLDPRTTDSRSKKSTQLAGGHVAMSLRGHLVQFGFFSAEPNDLLGATGGWIVGPIEVVGGRVRANDIAVESALFHVPYGHLLPELGPGSEVSIEANVRNHGAFRQDSLSLDVDFIAFTSNPPTRFTTTTELGESFVVDPQANKTARVVVTVPEVAGPYVVQVRARLGGGLVDENNANDCVTVMPTPPSLASCRLDATTERFNVQPRPSLRIERSTPTGVASGVSIIPSAGRADFPRLFLVNISNTGNVPVEDFLLRRTITRFSGGPVTSETESWTVARSPEPATGADWTTLPLSPAAEPVRQLGGVGRYLVTFQLLLPVERLPSFCHQQVPVAGKAYCELDREQVIAESFATLYADRFDGAGRVVDASIIRDDLTPIGPGFRLTDAIDHSGQGRSWWYGDPDRLQYPSSDQSILEFPRLDLTRAQKAVVSFLMNSSLERGYDGLVMEGSLDDGATWIPLRPEPNPLFDAQYQGYSGQLSATNPLHPDGDPTVPMYAFTGSTRGLLQGDDWVPVEFNLGAVPGFTTDTVLDAFRHDHVDPADVPETDPQNPKVSSAGSWNVPGEACPRCWARENLRIDDPTPVEGSEFWWTGAGSPTTASGVFEDVLRIPVDLSAYPPGSAEKVRLSFAGWGISPQGNWAGLGAAFPPTGRTVVKHEDGVRPADVRTGQTLGDDWTQFEVDLTPDKGSIVEVRFIFRKSLNAAADPMQPGWAIDDLRLLDFRESMTGARTQIHARAVSEAAASHQRTTGSVDCQGNAEAHCNDVGWRKAGPNAPPGAPPSRWSSDVKSGPTNVAERVWTWTCDAGNPGIPSLAAERLQSPSVDLRRVGGSQSSLTYWNTGALELHVQTRDAATQTWNDWKPLASTEVGAGSGWTQRQADLSPLIGQEARFGFLARSGVTCNTPPASVTGLEVRAETLAASAMRLRLRAGTDSTVSDGGWGLDALQIVGLLYTDNVAIVLSDASSTRDVSGDGPVILKGKVRNLSGQTIPRMILEAHAVPKTAGGSAPSLEPMDALGLPAGAAGGPLIQLGPFPLLPAGTPNQGGQPVDEFPFEVHVHLPPGVLPGSQYEVSLRLLARQTADGPPIAWRDESMGDHQRTIAIKIDPKSDVQAWSGTAVPSVATVSTPITLRLNVANLGNTEASALVQPQIRRIGDPFFVNPTPLAPQTAAPDPDGGEATLEWTWAPAERGVYAFDAVIRPSYSTLDARLAVDYFFVDAPPLYVQEDFETETRDDWSHFPTGAPMCGRQDEWASTTEDAWGGSTSFRVGVPRDAYSPPTNARYASAQESRLVAPRASLTAAWDVGTDLADTFDDQPVTSPFVTFRFQRRLASDDGVVLEARAYRPGEESFRDAVPFTLTPVGGYDTSMPSRSATCTFVPRALGGGPGPTADGNGWELASFPLAGVTPKLLGEDVEFSLRFNSDDENQEQAFYVDSFSISAFHARFEPTIQKADLVDNATKTYRFKVTNDGDAADTFHVSIRPDLSFLPPDIGLTLAPTHLTLERGESGYVEVGLATPLTRFQTSGPGPIVSLEVISEQDPNQVGSARLVIENYQPRRWPDLKASISLGSGVSPNLVAGDAAAVRVTVENLGLGASRPTNVLVLACPGQGQRDEVLQACKDALASASDIRSVRIAELQLGVLPSRSDVSSQFAALTRATFAFEWSPDRSGRGPFTLVAIADPNGRLVEYDTEDNIAFLPVALLGSQRPDIALVPGSLRVLNAAGAEVHSERAGSRLTIQASFENLGPVEARDALLRLTNQFVLREQRVPSIPAGATVDIQANWVALPGNWLVAAEAIVPQVELDASNNRGTWLLSIRKAGLQLEGVPQTVLVSPGVAEARTFTLRNQGDLPQDVSLQAVEPAGVEVTFRPDRAALAPNEDVTITMVVKATGTRAANFNLEVLARGSSADVAPASASVLLLLRPTRTIEAQASPVWFASTSQDVPLRIRSGPDLDETVLLTATSPAGWSVDLPEGILEIPKGTEVAVPLRVHVPADYAPGAYDLFIFADGKPLAQVEVRVQARVAWSISVARTDIDVEGGVARFLLLVGNEGNVPQQLDLAFDHLEGAGNISWQPPQQRLAPAEKILLPVEITSEDPQTRFGIAVGHGNLIAPAPTLALETRRPAPRIAEWSLTPPPPTFVAGQTVTATIRVADPNMTTGSTLVSLFVDGRLANTARVDLVEGAASAKLSWIPQPGQRVITILVGDRSEGQGSADSKSFPVEVDEPASAFPIPAMPLLLAALGVIAAALIRRRRTS